jgi:hypothetical protein
MTPSTEANAKVSSTSAQNPKVLPLRDGNASRSSREPTDGTTKVAALSGDQGPDLTGTQDEPVPGQRQLQRHENDAAQPSCHLNDGNTSEAHTTSDKEPTSSRVNPAGPQQTPEGETTEMDSVLSCAS